MTAAYMNLTTIHESCCYIHVCSCHITVSVIGRNGTIKSPSTIPIEARDQGSDEDGFLHPSFKPSRSVVRISVLSSSTVFSTCSVWICFATSELVELSLRCSLNLDFRDLSVSPTYVASHSSHLILYTGPTTFSLLIGSLGLTNSCHNVFVGLKYVGMPYFRNTHLICSKNSLMYECLLEFSCFSLYLSLAPLSYVQALSFCPLFRSLLSLLCKPKSSPHLSVPRGDYSGNWDSGLCAFLFSSPSSHPTSVMTLEIEIVVCVRFFSRHHRHTQRP